MYQAVFMAATGLTNQQRRLDTIGDNIANVNTVGYKTTRLDFKDALYTAGFGPAPEYTPDGNLQHGHGVIAAAINKDFSSGSPIITNNELDFIIEGDAFFEVMDQNGRRLYTKAGEMYASVEENGTYLVNAEGYYVQNADGERIIIPGGAGNIAVSSEGVLSFTVNDETYYDNFGLYTFTNKTGLIATGSRNYEPTVASGEPMAAVGVTIRQGAREASNVNLAQEMTRMIRTQRAFQLASRALTTADSMEGIANNMRR